MENFKDLRIVDNFYQTSAFFPMPTVLVGTVSENGMTNLGSYSLCFPYYIAGKERYAMLLECRNSSNTAQNILRNKTVSLNFIPDDRKFFREACAKLTKIPRVFLKAALAQMVAIAKEEGITVIDEAALQIINDKRRTDKNKK